MALTDEDIKKLRSTLGIDTLLKNYWLLPTNPNFDYSENITQGETLVPGQVKAIYETLTEKHGWFLFAMLVTDSPNVRETTTMFSKHGKYSQCNLSAQTGVNLGLIGFNPATPWVAKYDTVNNTFVLMYTPVPAVPFNAKMQKVLTNDGTTNAKVSFAQVDVMFVD